MTTTYTAAQITAIGGRDWQRDDKHRVYLNDPSAMIGLEIDTYGTGNISSATLNGERISNAAAGRLRGAIDKVYLDVASGTIFVSWGHTADRYDKADLLKQVAAWVAARVAELTPAPAPEPVPAAPVAPSAPAAPVDAAAVVARLRAAGSTVREIAAAVGVHRSTVYRWARTEFRPAQQHAAALTALAA